MQSKVELERCWDDAIWALQYDEPRLMNPRVELWIEGILAEERRDLWSKLEASAHHRPGITTVQEFDYRHQQLTKLMATQQKRKREFASTYRQIWIKSGE